MAGRFCVHLIFLFFLSTAQNFTEREQNNLENDTVGEDEEVHETTISTVSTPDPCHCSPITYGKDEMSGELKSPGYPNSYCHNLNCTYEIEPHPDRLIRLSAESMNMEMEYDFLHLYQYVVINNTKQLIYYRDLNGHNRGGSNVVGKGVGIFIIMTSDHNNGGTFKLSFERVFSGQSTVICPYPFLYAAKEVQSIQAGSWPTTGCSFHIFSPSPILLYSSCDNYDSGWNLRMYHPGNTHSYDSDTVIYGAPYTSRAESLDISISPRSSPWLTRALRPTISCKLSYQTSDSNACVCPQNRNLSIGESMNISSPGYPYLTCEQLRCSTTISAPQSQPGFKTGFTIFAFHSPKSLTDSLQIGIGSTIVISLTNLEEVKSTDEALTMIGDSMRIGYSAKAAFEKDHGFTMTVEAVSIPLDCICPSNAPKLLRRDGTYSFTIPPHCKVLTCRYEIPAASYSNRLFRLQTNYIFPNEGESLTIRSKGMTHRYGSLGSVSVRKRLNMVTNGKISILYRRDSENETATAPSSVNLTWTWLGSYDCACHDGLQKAEEEWMDIYSPRYPNDDYCLNSRCVYLLEAPEGHHVEMNVTFFETEPHSDFVTFFDGNDTTKRHILQLNGHVLMAPIVESTGRNATVVFTSDNSVTAKGFVIAFRSVPNDDFIELPSHYLTITYFIFIIMFVMIFGGAVGYIIIKRREHSFKNPVYIPNIRYSVSGEREIAVEEDSY